MNAWAQPAQFQPELNLIRARWPRAS